MLNWRRIAVTGLVAGMVAVTGCSTNLPETNQGNRNGQRVVDSVNRRSDTYRGTGIEQDGVVGRTTRGIRRATHNVTNPTRSTTRNTRNSLNIGRPQGRVGNTYRYGNNHRVTRGLDNNRTGDYSCYNNYENYNCYGTQDGYDYGVSAADRAIVNNRTTRNTAVTPAVTPSTEKTETKRVDTKRKATPDKPAKSAKPEVKKAEAKKTETVTRSAVPAPAAPKVTHRATHKANVNRATNTNRIEKNHVQTRNNQARHIAPNTIPVPSTTATPKKANTNRYGMNLNTNRPNRAARRNANKNTNVNRNTNINRHSGINKSTSLDQTVAVINSEDNVISNNDMAFFRKKTEEPTNTMPPPAETPNETTPIPAPRTQSYNDYYDSGYDDVDDYNENETAPQPTPAPTNPTKLPTRATVTRIAK